MGKVKSRPRISEHSMQRSVIAWANLMAVRKPPLRWLYANANGGDRGGGIRGIVAAGKMNAEGVKRGVPDLFLPVPRGRYHGLYLEMKSERGKLSSEQKEWLAYLGESGYRTCVAFSVLEATSCILEYLDLPMEA